MKKNDFEQLCDRMEKYNKVCKKNEIICATKYLREYANGDIYKLLKIKAEASSVAYHTFIATVFGMTAFAISCFSLFIGLFKEPKGDINATILIATLVLVVILGKNIWSYRNVRKWQDYVLVAIKEIEEEYRRN